MPPHRPDGRAIHKGFNAHGFGFHDSVIKEIERVAKAGEFGWEFIGAGAPHLCAKPRLTQPSSSSAPRNERIALVNANGSIERCLDGRLLSRHTRWAPRCARYRRRAVLRTVAGVRHFLRTNTLGGQAHQVGLPIKTEEPGHGCGSDRKAIADAVTQVSRAANGFMQLCAENEFSIRSASGGEPMRIVPAVFSTASLNRADQDLSISDLASGDLPTASRFIPENCLWFQHALNRSLQAQIPGRFGREART